MNEDEQLLELIRRINSHLVVRAARPGDAPGFERLMNRHYRRQKPDGYYRWRFGSCPYPSQLIVAMGGNELVACMGGHVLTLLDGRRVLFAVDLLVEERHRNGGIHRLLEAKLELFGRSHGAVALASLPNELGRQAHLGVPGCRCIGSMTNLVRPASPPRSGGHGTYEMAAGRIAFRRDADYRQWRFDRNPEYRYTRVTVNGGTFAMAKTFRDTAEGRDYVDLVEYGNDAGGPVELAPLVRGTLATEELGGSDGALTAWAAPHAPAYAALTSLGFAPQGRARAFCVRLFEAGHDDLLDFTRWDLVEADSEVY